MSNQKNLCNVMREQWRSLIAMLDYAASLLKRVLNQIQALIDRLKNTVIKSIANAIRDLKDIISKYLGLQAIDTNSARKDFCTLLYGCKPALELIANYVDPDLFNWIFGKDEIKSFNLSAYGLPAQTFNSKFEVFDFVACRLSLSGMLNSAVENMISGLMELIGKFDKYLQIDWWLKNTVWGRVLKRLMDTYESIFNDYVKPYLNKLTPFLDCGFALCDFTHSTSNYLEDYKDKYRLDMRTLPDLKRDWRVVKEELYKDLKDYMSETSKIFTDFKYVYIANMNKGSDTTYVKGGSVASQTLPYSSEEKEKTKYALTERKNMLTPALTSDAQTKIGLRAPLILQTPNSEVSV